MRSIDKLLAELFCNQEIPGPNCTGRGSRISIGLYKSEPRDSLLKIASKTPTNVLELHGPSTYTLSMVLSHKGNVTPPIIHAHFN